MNRQEFYGIYEQNFKGIKLNSFWGAAWVFFIILVLHNDEELSMIWKIGDESYMITVIYNCSVDFFEHSGIEGLFKHMDPLKV